MMVLLSVLLVLVLFTAIFGVARNLPVRALPSFGLGLGLLDYL